MGRHTVKHEFCMNAAFADRGSPASCITASKLDAVAVLLGSKGKQSDAPSAYTHSKLGTGMKGNTLVTWVRLPYRQWSQKWKSQGRTDPVCPLRLSGYGHPMRGTYLENQCVVRLEPYGWRKMMGWGIANNLYELLLINALMGC